MIEILGIIGAIIAIVSAWFSWIQAKAAEASSRSSQEQADIAKQQVIYARQQAEAAKQQANLLREAKITKLIEDCEEFYKRDGQWLSYLDSVPDLTAQDWLTIDSAIRTRLSKSIERQNQKQFLLSWIKKVSIPGRCFGLNDDKIGQDVMDELVSEGKIVVWHGEYFLKGHEPKE